MTAAALSTAAAAAAMVACLRLAWLGLRTDGALPRLDQVIPGCPTPSLSVVVPCRDEARSVEAAVRSLLAQDLPDLEVIAVDDRSSDGTGAILDRLAAEDPRLAVIHVDALPSGWLGKNHACEIGARHARGDWLLFTDGDVVFAPGSLRLALAFAESRRLGHVVAVPRFVAPGYLERAFVTAFALFAASKFRVFELPRPGTRGFIGAGAFNLVRRDAWMAVGGHRRIAFEVVDDVKLGLVLRRSGVPQGAVDSAGLVSVRWQHGFAASAAGLVKNAFAATEYRLGRAARISAGLALLGLAPLVCTLAGPVPARVLGLAALVLSAALHGAVARRVGGGTGLEGLAFAPCALLLSAVLIASAVVAVVHGSVVWRGTRYPLAALRAGCVRASEWPAGGAAGWPGPAGDPAGITDRHPGSLR
jgi:hypothetical protein